MLIPPHYVLTPHISQLLASIESAKAIIDTINIPGEIEINIRRQSTLRSSLFSARIEGNSLTPEDLDRTPSRTQKKIEVFNVLKALNWVYTRSGRDIAIKDILSLHTFVMQQLSPTTGTFRNEVSAIFNASGIAIYLPPPPRHIIPLLNRFISYVNGTKEPLIPVKAALAHYIFEKIHPFLDGNGRVGRLLLQFVLHREGYGMKGLLAIEEYLDNHRSEYYHALENPERDTTDYVEFILEALANASNIAKDQVIAKKQTEVEDYLLPRRAEIYRITKDQKLINFDSLKRRFRDINERTLRYDLKQLINSGLIRKRGATKGVYYQAIPSR